MVLWIIFLLLAVAYFAFKIGRIYDPSQASKYVGSGKFLTLFGKKVFFNRLAPLCFSLTS